MQRILILLMLLYIAALSRSFFPFGSKENEQENPSTEVKRDQIDIDTYWSEESNSKISDQEDDETYFLPNFALEYRGKWDSLEHDKGITSFNKNTGLITFISTNEELNDSHGYFDIWCYDGMYVDQKAVKISFGYNNSVDFDAWNFHFKNANVEMKVAEFDNFEQISEKVCKGSYRLDFINPQTQKPYTKITNNEDSVIIQIRLSSYECGITLNASVAAENSTFESTTMDYSIMMTLLCLVQLYACVQMIKYISQDELSGHGYSLITLSILTAWDIFLCFFHFFQSFYAGSNYFQYFISPAFWYFIVATIFETRLLTVVWKARYFRSYENTAEVRKGFASFYIRLYGFLSSLIFLGYMFLPSVWFMYLTSLFFVPQIAHNCIRGLKPKFEILYIFFFGFLRTLLPMYIRGCTNSIFHLTPSEGFIANYAGIVSLQIFLMYAQSKLGSRFFIPARFLPPKYNYYIDKADALKKEENCSICMDDLGQEPSGSKTPFLKNSKKCQGQVMQTPCNHLFHGKCLKDWMEIKLECPYCRSALPSLD